MQYYPTRSKQLQYLYKLYTARCRKHIQAEDPILAVGELNNIERLINQYGSGSQEESYNCVLLVVDAQQQQDTFIVGQDYNEDYIRLSAKDNNPRISEMLLLKQNQYMNISSYREILLFFTNPVRSTEIKLPVTFHYAFNVTRFPPSLKDLPEWPAVWAVYQNLMDKTVAIVVDKLEELQNNAAAHQRIEQDLKKYIRDMQEKEEKVARDPHNPGYYKAQNDKLRSELAPLRVKLNVMEKEIELLREFKNKINRTPR